MAETKGSVTLRFDYRWLVVALLVVIAVMLVLWRPWEPRYDKNASVVTANGQSTVKATPDEYVFRPSYSFENTDKTVSLGEANKKADEVVKGLRAAGAADKDIKSNVSGYNTQPLINQATSSYQYTAAVTVTIHDNAIAQKVQDYLVTTSPEGDVTPQITFSEATRKQLEATARDEASKDARKKAEQLATNLGGRLGAIKSVTDGTGFGDTVPMYATAGEAGGKAVPPSSILTLQPGENELTYTVSVVYYLQ